MIYKITYFSTLTWEKFQKNAIYFIRKFSIDSVRIWHVWGSSLQSWARDNTVLPRQRDHAARPNNCCLSHYIYIFVVATPFRHQGSNIVRIFACHFSSNTLCPIVALSLSLKYTTVAGPALLLIKTSIRRGLDHFLLFHFCFKILSKMLRFLFWIFPKTAYNCGKCVNYITV